MRGVYEKLLQLAAKLGSDVSHCDHRAAVEKTRFVQLKPTTDTRLDLSLSLTPYDRKYPQRLVDAGGLAKKDRTTNRIELLFVREIDCEVAKWLTIAYDLDARQVVEAELAEIVELNRELPAKSVVFANEDGRTEYRGPQPTLIANR